MFGDILIFKVLPNATNGYDYFCGRTIVLMPGVGGNL